MSSSSSNCRRRSTTTKDEEAADFPNRVLQEIGFVKESFEAVKIKASQKIDEANEAQNQFEELMVMPAERAEERDHKLRQLKMKVSKLRMDIPVKLIAAPSDQPDPINIRRWRHLDSNLYGDNEINHNKPDIDDHDDNPVPPVPYHEIDSILESLPSWEKEYVACFIFFPKNAVIKKLVLSCLQPTLLDTSDTGLGALAERGLVQAVYKKSNLTVDGYRMLPRVHSYLRSEASGFNKKWANMYVGHSHDVEEKFIYHTAQDFQPFNNHTGCLKTVLHLGKWNNSTKQHIEIIDPEFFFKHMSKHTELRYVSLRGISMIEELPDFITNLKKLLHLDLRACHNLEVIPPSIAKLKNNLTYLDISECYFLDHMPKALASLIKLRVLKGFEVGEKKDGISCSLEDLASLHFLEKLNIYTSMTGFPTNTQLRTLQGFWWLLSLSISWGGCSAPNGMCKASQEDGYGWLEKLIDGGHVFRRLEKLDLQCVPESVTRHWLNPTIFRNLNMVEVEISLLKSYIRGGNFFDLDRSWEGSQWKVETLRLKHLCKVKMDWGEFQRLFPKLICLEKVDCPNLHRFPCNESGIWMKNLTFCSTPIDYASSD